MGQVRRRHDRAGIRQTPEVTCLPKPVNVDKLNRRGVVIGRISVF
jgi:hypothetical protein